MPHPEAIVAIASGDPAGIGPEIAIKTALDDKVRAACRPLVVSDPAILERHAKSCGIDVSINVVRGAAEAGGGSRTRIDVLAVPQPDAAALPFGASDAASGRASLAFAARAIKAALDGEVSAVVAAPQNETSIHKAGVAFDGYPSFVAKETGTPIDDVYLMLCFGETKIVHATLHQSVRDSLDALTRERLDRVIVAAERALKRLGTAAPRIVVGGLNPHAGEGGLFGREEIETIAPAVAAAKARGLNAEGPYGADTMFHMKGVDAFIVMLHDQGHITAKLLARNATAGLAIGTPILFSSVAHGSAHDIAGKGIASPTAMVEAVLRLSKAGAARRAAAA